MTENTTLITAEPDKTYGLKTIFKVLKNPVLLFVLFVSIWVPLTVYVIFQDIIGDNPRMILLPAIPATIILYIAMVVNWRYSITAIIGSSLVFFWLFIAISVPFMGLDPEKAVAINIQPFNYAQSQTTINPDDFFANFGNESKSIKTETRTESEKGEFFILGTDFAGRSILARTLWGSQRVIVWGITATLVAYIFGISFGLISGYIGGWVDEIIQFIANVFLSFPIMVLFIIILNYLGSSPLNIVIAVTFASAPSIARIVRGLTLDIKTRDYVYAAQVRGETSFYIMVFELLPNARGPVIVDACLRLGYTTVAITTLTFLGLGLQPPQPDWGLMIKEARNVAQVLEFSYQLIIPALSVSSLILGFNLIADGLHDLTSTD